MSRFHELNSISRILHPYDASGAARHYGPIRNVLGNDRTSAHDRGRTYFDLWQHCGIGADRCIVTHVHFARENSAGRNVDPDPESAVMAHNRRCTQEAVIPHDYIHVDDGTDRYLYTFANNG